MSQARILLVDDEPVIVDLADQGMDRVVTMQDTLRAARRTRCIENHPDCVRVERRKLSPAPFALEHGFVSGVTSGVPAQHNYFRR